jgi:quinol monooxygenase YgiN
MEAESQAAAAEVMARVKGHVGLVDYTWNVDPADQSLVVMEVHEDETSVFNHMRLTLVPEVMSRFSATIKETKNVRMYGPPPSAELEAALKKVGDFKAYRTV